MALQKLIVGFVVSGMFISNNSEGKSNCFGSFDDKSTFGTFYP